MTSQRNNSTAAKGRPITAGRTLRKNSDLVVSQPRPGSSWRTARICLELDGLSEDEQRLLAGDWTQAGLYRHAAVASFHRHGLELIALGAPVDLVREATECAGEELNHASLCFDLAAAYAQRPSCPGPLPMGSSIELATRLEDLALGTLIDGCISETLAAVEANQRAQRAQLPEVAAAFARIARDETRHAEFAWRTLTWACIQTGSAAHQRLDVAFRDQLEQHRQAAGKGEIRTPSPALMRHGYITVEERRHLAQCTFEEVLVPCFQDLSVTLKRTGQARSPQPAA